MLFETSRLYVTKWKKQDLDVLYNLFNDSAIKDFIAPRLTIEETEQIFHQQLLDYNNSSVFGRYFIKEKLSSKFIGLFLLKNIPEMDSVEIGYSLIKEEWKKGYATEVVNESLNWLFNQQGFTKVYAVTELDNSESQNVLLKAGFKRENDIVEDGRAMSLFMISKRNDPLEWPVC
ncbi:MAG: GNAT family N-acetyltransferase [Ginsengibacter sp.]